MIYHDIHKLAKELEYIKQSYDGVVVTSGGFDPLHVGHLRCIQESKTRSDEHLVVIVNGDGFLSRKKGKPFMPVTERVEIINAIRGVDYVISWDDGSQNVVGALEILKPHIFTKGGDRSSRDMVPEADICDKLGIRIRYGVGGTNKAQSSSTLIKNVQLKECQHRWVMEGHNAGDPICSICFKRG